jgi:hypothetical protein
MRPVEIQNSIMQAPSAERNAQQQVTRTELAQQTFQQQLERTASQRPSQVQATQPAVGADAVAITPDEHGEQRRRRRSPRRAPAPGAGQGPAANTAAPEPVTPGSKIDVVI